MRRQAYFDYTTEKDLRWLYASYKSGDFQEFGTLPEDLSPENFDDHMATWLTEIVDAGHWVMTLYAPTQKRDAHIPVAIAVVLVQPFHTDTIMAPHIHFFKWATPRNRIETAVMLAAELKKHAPFQVLIDTKKDIQLRFINHLCRYNLMRPVGTLKHMSKDTTMRLFEAVR